MDSKHTFLRRVASVRASAVLIGLLAAAVCWGQSGQSQEVRTWTDSSGLYKVKASLVRQEGDSVRLKGTDGKVIDVPLDRLS